MIFFTKNPNLNKKNKYFLGGWGERWGEWMALD